MNKATYAAAAATLALAAPVMAQQPSKSDSVGDQTTIAVQLASQSHATGSATFTKTKDGVMVKVTTTTSPSGTQVAEIRKGSCASSGMGLKSKGGPDSAMGASAGGSGTGGSGTNMPPGAPAPAASGMSAMKSMPGAAAYQIGKLTVAQGDQGQPIGAAQTTLKNVSLTQLVSGGYTVAVLDSAAASNASALCGDLNNALAPTTPATVNKSQ